MLVNYKGSNILTVERGVGKSKLIFVPGVNVIPDEEWKDVEKNLAGHIKDGKVNPIYKVVKGKDGKEEKSPVTPDEIPNDQLDSVVNEIKSEAQAEKFVASSAKESVRAKAMNRKDAIAKEIQERVENK